MFAGESASWDAYRAAARVFAVAAARCQLFDGRVIGMTSLGAGPETVDGCIAQCGWIVCGDKGLPVAE
jgi:hypothetical protein